MQSISDAHLYARLADAYGCPFYLYDEASIAAQLGVLRYVFEDFSILYSVKTNPHPAVCRFMASVSSHATGADAASSYEVNKALEAGFSPEDIFYSAPGKTRKELDDAWGKCLITADSYTELARLDAIARESGVDPVAPAPVGLRINPDFSFGSGEFPHTGPGTSAKFGVDEERLALHRDLFASLKYIRVTGIHVFLRSQVLDHKALGAAFADVFRLAEYCTVSFGWKLSFLNFGGGVGIAPPDAVSGVDTTALRDTVRQLVTMHSPSLPGCRLLMESGRFLTARAGTYVTRIEDIKESRGVTYVIAPGGLNGFLRPAMMNLLNGLDSTQGPPRGPYEPLYSNAAAHGVSLPGKEGKPLKKVTVCGNLCTGLDVVARDVLLPEPRIGDILTISNAGAYAATLSPFAFASFPRPAEVYRTRDNDFLTV